MILFEKSIKTITQTNAFILFAAFLLSFFVLIMPLAVDAQSVTDPEMVDSLIKDLHDPDKEVRGEAARHSGSWGTRQQSSR